MVSRTKTSPARATVRPAKPHTVPGAPAAGKVPAKTPAKKAPPPPAHAVGKSSGATAARFELTGPLYSIYKKIPYLSYKHSSYFQVYEHELSRFIGQPITFVEVGVLNGGSLFMWREFFGPKARIIGVDFNPGAKKWEKDGFEIHIGDQSSPAFWQSFFKQVGPVDVLLDDGGHTNAQQIVTCTESLPYIKNDGLLMVEDTHCSYMPEFGNPSRFSFTSFAKNVADAVNARFPEISGHHENPFRNRVFATTFYESIVVFRIDARRAVEPLWLSNEGQSSEAADYRHVGTTTGSVMALETRVRQLLAPAAGLLKRQPFLGAKRAVFKTAYRLAWEHTHRKTRKYFK